MRGKITKISGPVVVAELDASMYEIVRVGEERLIGEVIEIRGNRAIVQVYEDTVGLRIGEPVERTGRPLSVELGPGLLGSIYDGLERPLEQIYNLSNSVFIRRGIDVPALDRKRKWTFVKTFNGNRVRRGNILGYVQETPSLKHYILSSVDGELIELKSGDYRVDEPIGSVRVNQKEQDITMMQRWPVRVPRPIQEKFATEIPLITGIRIIDSLFPIAKGGVVAIPGPFGSGKTVTQQSLAKYSDADVVVYIGCGERGNEMTEVLVEFPHLKDPKTGNALMNRTVLIANTSNMPVAAREASIYVGITIAEYFRDMGYDVALMADSTSRWAEALREISGRLEEMPGEEGYPSYLSKKIAEFYERAGRVKTLNGDTGSISVIGAVSPPGGDLSEPVSQNTLRVVKGFLALDASLAQRRHFPSINWLRSYSLYRDIVYEYYRKNVDQQFPDNLYTISRLLQREAELQEIVQLVGPDALPEREQFILLIGKMIREDFLQQNAFDEIDAYSSLEKQSLMIRAIVEYYNRGLKHIEQGTKTIQELRNNPITDKIAKMKFMSVDEIRSIFKMIEVF
ncbi:MAG: V-type ATP synthase subunit A [Candidatus Micrarchaeota archaeon]|nr:V-type ATP synthase subunit A [Candidatus Micrarchaeota archaeon]MCX8154382.1 V-type ATP synthase subunit A [Candidatus Micrarchaeota archaeon]